MEVKIIIVCHLFGILTLLGSDCITVEYRPVEKDVAKAIILNRMVHPSDNMFERQTKFLVSNFLVNSALSRDDSDPPKADSSQDVYDYDSIFTDVTSTTPRVFTWPPIFHNAISTTTPDPNSPIAEYSPIIQSLNPTNGKPTEEEAVASTTTASSTSTSTSTEVSILHFIDKQSTTPKPQRKPPGGLIGAVQYFTLIVPDALRPGRNNTSLLNRQSITSILKIIGSVAFLNVTGVIDNSVQLGTSPPVRELVDGVTNLVLCNQVIKGLSGGRCHRRLFEGDTVNLKDFMGTN